MEPTNLVRPIVERDIARAKYRVASVFRVCYFCGADVDLGEVVKEAGRLDVPRRAE